MTIQHSALTGSDLHEPKGAATALSGQSYLADGAGSGSWRYTPHGGFYYTDIGAGTTYTAPTSYTLINPTTVGDTISREFTHSGSARLTYTGTTTIDLSVKATICFKHSAGAGADCYFQVHKNGSPVVGTAMVNTADSTTYSTVTVNAHINSLVTNDYVEFYCKVASGNIIVHAINVEVIGRI